MEIKLHYDVLNEKRFSIVKAIKIYSKEVFSTMGKKVKAYLNEI